jgi:PhoD related phosphatase
VNTAAVCSCLSRYYVLFQHHLAPPKYTFTSDAEATEHEGGSDPVQEKGTFVLTEKSTEPQYIVGHQPGPYVEERSRSIVCQLGARIGFMGIDARLERTRHQVNYPETYDMIFKRLQEMYTANKNLKHLIVLLGIPIAYPRLQWLENLFRSPIIGPIRFLNKRFGLAGGFFNKFDGAVDLLDDLDDHYTTRLHKSERRLLIQRLQEFSKEYSARVTILGGDVHLCAIGRFYSNPKLKIPSEHDWRYIPNVISSAITNKPPPSAIADLLSRRNRIHHLDSDTDETLLEIFDHDPGMGDKKKIHEEKVESKHDHHHLHHHIIPKKKTMHSNKVTMPSRNYAILEESGGPTSTSTAAPPAPGETPEAATSPSSGNVDGRLWHPSNEPGSYNMRKAINEGEKNAGSQHAASSGLKPSGLGGPYGLDVTLRVEISNEDGEGHTEGYGFTVPGLDSTAYKSQGSKW